MQKAKSPREKCQSEVLRSDVMRKVSLRQLPEAKREMLIGKKRVSEKPGIRKEIHDVEIVLVDANEALSAY